MRQDRQNALREILFDRNYFVDCENGKVFVKQKDGTYTDKYCKKKKDGYYECKFKINGREWYFARHQIIFFVDSGGKLPIHAHMIDHINRIKGDDRIVNLRLVDYIGNAKNRDDSKRSRNPRITTIEELKDIELLELVGLGQILISKILNLNKTTVGNILRKIRSKKISELEQ